MDKQEALERYIHDYMVKKNMPEAAEIFSKEANVSKDPVEFEEPHSFLSEWWEIFWCSHRINEIRNSIAKKGSPAKDNQMMEGKQEDNSPPKPTQDINQMAVQSPRSKQSTSKADEGSSFVDSQMMKGKQEDNSPPKPTQDTNQMAVRSPRSKQSSSLADEGSSFVNTQMMEGKQEDNSPPKPTQDINQMAVQSPRSKQSSSKADEGSSFVDTQMMEGKQEDNSPPKPTKDINQNVQQGIVMDVDQTGMDAAIPTEESEMHHKELAPS